MENPDQLQHLVDHPEDIPAAVEEMLRYNTAFIATADRYSGRSDRVIDSVRVTRSSCITTR